jgi:hypothetical protein
MAGLPSLDIDLESILAPPFSSQYMVASTVDYVLTTDNTLSAAPWEAGPGEGLLGDQVVRIGEEGPGMREWTPSLRGGLCGAAWEGRQGLRSRYLVDPVRGKIYVTLVDEPNMVSGGFLRALGHILERDKEGAVLLVSHASPLAWEASRAQVVEGLGSNAAAVARFFVVGGGQGAELDPRFAAAADVLLEPYPLGGRVETFVRALLGCGGRTVPAVTLSSERHPMAPRPVLPRVGRAVDDIVPLATDVEDFVSRAVALANVKSVVRKRLEAVVAKARVPPPSSNTEAEEGIAQAVGSEMYLFLQRVIGQ